MVKVYEDSEAPVTGIIEKYENKFIKLKIINSNNSDGEVELSTVLGYENDPNLISPSGTTLVTEKIDKTNYMITTHSKNSENKELFLTNVTFSSV